MTLRRGLVACGVGLLLVLMAMPPAEAQRRATPEEAQAAVSAAVARYDEAGAAAAFAEITGGVPAFRHDDLYVFVVALDGTVAAHGGNPDFVGQDARGFHDGDGRAFVLEQIEIATPEGLWHDYRWADPLTGEMVPKTSWIVLHDGYVFGAGVYVVD